jgi:hypothetical protein
LADEGDLLKVLLPEKVLGTAYEDMLSSPAKEVGKLATDVVKTARLLLAPFQIAAAFQDRVERMVERISERVPEERRITAPAEVAGPALEQMRYLDDENPLWQMFEELLSRSVDEVEVSKVHPSFAHIISQLARDEAVILYRLKESNFEVVDVLDLNAKENRFENRRIEESNLPTNALFLPDMLDLYYSHLESLSLVSWPVYAQDPIKDATGRQTGIRRRSRMHLTEFGRLFTDACIPEQGFRFA